VKTLKAYFGLSDDGTQVGTSTSIGISLALSLLVSFGLRFLIPGASPVIRLVLWFVVMVVLFRWAASNAQKQRGAGPDRR
jgi:hypothetical protein